MAKVSFINRFRGLLDGIRRFGAPPGDWFQVEFDSRRVVLSAQPPGRDPWQQSFSWDEVQRVCFVGEGGCASDGIYVFTSRRPESFLLPGEAQGGEAFVQELIDRGYFDSENFVEAVLDPHGAYCSGDKETR